MMRVRADVVAGAVALFLLTCSEARAEVSIDRSGGAGGHAALSMALRGHEGPSPWGRVRQQVPSSWLLNPDGDVRGDGRPEMTALPATGNPQVVWAARAGDGFDIVHSEWGGRAWTTPEIVAGGAADQRGPAIAARDDGALAVTWWEDDGVFRQVFVRRRDAQGTWLPAEPVSAADRTARWPAVAFDGGDLWVGWEREAGPGAREIVVALESQGWNPVMIGETSHVAPDGSLDAQLVLHARNGRVWADWLLAADRIATSRLDPQTGQWGAVEEIPCDDSPEGRNAARFEAKRRALGW